MAEQPTVTTPGGSDLFAGLHGLDYAAFGDDAMEMLVDASGRTPTFRTGLTPGGQSLGGTGGGGSAEPFVMTPRTADFMAELAASATPANAQTAQPPPPTAMLFDHDLVTGGARALQTAVVKEEDEDELDDDGDALRPDDDLPTPLSFSFTPTGAGGANGAASASGGGRYHVAAAHKHKRVRSNPDMLQNLNFQTLLGSTNPQNNNHNATSPLRPSVGDGSALMGSMGGLGNGGSVSLPTTPLDGNAQYEPLPAPLPISIGTVNVVTPVGFHGGDQDPRSQNGGDDTFPSDMDSFLKEMQWSELAENNNSMNVDTLSSLGAGYRSQRIQAGVNELKMKRKRPTQHMRHHSNPVDLLHNLDQFRMLSQQQQQQQQQQQHQQQQLQAQLPQQQQQYTPPPSPPLPMQYPSPTKLGAGSGMMAMPMQQQQQAPMMAPPDMYGMQPGMAMPEMQFQVPADIANGSARSLHARRSSMPNSAFARGRGGAGGHRRGASRGGSTGLSMDMSQLNLEFLTLPEDEFQQQLQQQRQQQAFQQAMSGAFPSPPPSPPLQNFQQQLQNSPGLGMSMGESEAEKNRKSYKCGRCGKPKVGHVCTMPDLRNNWTQVDVEVTKGIKVVRTNCHIVATKNRWVPQHEDNL